MRLALLADFWPWFNQLHDSEKIAFWAMLVSIATALVGVIVGFVAALYGAKYGAEAAYRLGRIQQLEDLENRQYAALIATQSALASQWNVIEGIRQRNLEALKEDVIRFIKMPVLYVTDVAMHVPFSDIVFIAEPGLKGSKNMELVNPVLLQRIYVAEQCYSTVMASLKLFRKSRGAIDLKVSQSSSPLQDKEFEPLKEAVNNVYVHVDHALNRIRATNIDVGKYMLKRFPDRGALEITDLKQTAPSHSK